MRHVNWTHFLWGEWIPFVSFAVKSANLCPAWKDTWKRTKTFSLLWIKWHLQSSLHLSVISATRFARLLLDWRVIWEDAVKEKALIQKVIKNQETVIICEDGAIIYIYIYTCTYIFNIILCIFMSIYFTFLFLSHTHFIYEVHMFIAMENKLHWSGLFAIHTNNFWKGRHPSFLPPPPELQVE